MRAHRTERSTSRGRGPEAAAARRRATRLAARALRRAATERKRLADLFLDVIGVAQPRPVRARVLSVPRPMPRDALRRGLGAAGQDRRHDVPRLPTRRRDCCRTRSSTSAMSLARRSSYARPWTTKSSACASFFDLAAPLPSSTHLTFATRRRCDNCAPISTRPSCVNWRTARTSTLRAAGRR